MKTVTLTGGLGAVAILFTTNGTAHAYIDPGSAGIALQALIGALAAAGLFLGTRLSRIRSLIRRIFRSQPAPPHQSKQTSQQKQPNKQRSPQ